jgi:hypothetical protein
MNLERPRFTTSTLYLYALPAAGVSNGELELRSKFQHTMTRRNVCVAESGWSV